MPNLHPLLASLATIASVFLAREMKAQVASPLATRILSLPQRSHLPTATRQADLVRVQGDEDLRNGPRQLYIGSRFRNDGGFTGVDFPPGPMPRPLPPLKEFNSSRLSPLMCEDDCTRYQTLLLKDAALFALPMTKKNSYRRKNLAIELLKRLLRDSPSRGEEFFKEVYRELENSKSIQKIGLLDRPYSSYSGTNDEAFAMDRLTVKGFRLEQIPNEPRFTNRFDDNPSVTLEACGRDFPSLLEAEDIFIVDISEMHRYNKPATPWKYTPSTIAYFCRVSGTTATGHPISVISNRRSLGRDGQGLIPKAEEKLIVFAIHVVDNGITYTPQLAGMEDPTTGRVVKWTNSTASEWQLAKMAADAAEGVAQAYDHFIHVHLILDPVRVELHRQLHPTHPVHVLLEHHMSQLFFNDFQAISLALFAPGGGIDMVFGPGSVGSHKWVVDAWTRLEEEGSFWDADLYVRMAQRGTAKIPGFKRQDDLISFYDAIRTFVKNYLSAYYFSDGDVVADWELQSWGVATSGVIPGFPGTFRSLDEVVRVVTSCIYRTAALHHTMNADDTWHMYALPHKPMTLHYPMPSQPGESVDLQPYYISQTVDDDLTKEDILAEHLLVGSAYVRPLHRPCSLMYSYESLDLGQYAAPAVREFARAMEAIQAKIHTREGSLPGAKYGQDGKFNLLDPANLPFYCFI